MTRDEAIAYIRAHPAQFKGASESEVLSKTQSSNDPNYYNPTTYDPEQKKTVVKANTPTRGATVGPSKPIQPKLPPAPIPKTGPPVASPPATQAMIGKFKGPNALPWVLGVLAISLGAGMAIFKASR